MKNRVEKNLRLMDHFSRHPNIRPSNGVAEELQVFKSNVLLPLLETAIAGNYRVVLDLTGFNRYTPTFLNRLFEDIIELLNISNKDLRDHLTVEHYLLGSYVTQVWRIIDKSN